MRERPAKKMDRTKAQKRWDERFTTKKGDIRIRKERDAVEILEAVKRSRISSKEAANRLVKLGYYRADAEDLIYIAKGGSDVIVNGKALTRSSESL